MLQIKFDAVNVSGGKQKAQERLLKLDENFPTNCLYLNSFVYIWKDPKIDIEVLLQILSETGCGQLHYGFNTEDWDTYDFDMGRWRKQPKYGSHTTDQAQRYIQACQIFGCNPLPVRFEFFRRVLGQVSSDTVEACIKDMVKSMKPVNDF